MVVSWTSRLGRDLAAQSEMALSPESRRLRVLLVDDEPEQLRLLARHLGAHEVVLAERVDAALEVLATSEFDVVVTDNGMPGASGVDLLTRVAADYPGVFRIMHSGSVPEDLDALVAAGVIERFVAKPGTEALVRLCGRHRQCAATE